MTSTNTPNVFSGGDIAGTAETAVEAVADGKLAAWSIHKYLQSLHNIKISPEPRFIWRNKHLNDTRLSFSSSKGHFKWYAQEKRVTNEIHEECV